MLQITCLGAARTVTGASFHVEMTDGTCFLVDCGMHQGGRQTEMRNWSIAPYRLPNLGGIFVTHAHMDHSGLVPRLVRQGYRQPVWATEATCELLRLLWLDAAHIQEMDAEWQSRKNKRRGRLLVEPLYETVDAEKASSLLRPIRLEQSVTLLPGVSTRFVTAGHILGAASLHLTLTEPEGPLRLGFSGDLGRPGQLIIPDPEKLPQVDAIFMETTYGSRLHKSLADSQTELITVIKEAYREQGKVLIPAFAVERTQEIIYTLARAYESGDLPPDMPVYLDSPLGIKATAVFNHHPELFDLEALELVNHGHAAINLPSLKATPTTMESQKINDDTGPAIIIAGSGMANAGRIRHHLKHNLWRPNCHVVIVGFQAEGTPGRRLVEGATRIRLLGEDVAVKAKVHTIGGFSAHADQNELLTWLERQAHPGLNVYLVHGEESAALTFKEVAQARVPGVNFQVPYYKETLTPGRTTPPLEAPSPALAEDSAAALLRIKKRMETIMARLATRTALPPTGLTVLDQALTEAEKALGD